METRFPTWDIRADPQDSSGTAEPPPELNDWTFLLEHLVRVSRGLSEDERLKLIDGLAEAGLVPEGQTEWPRHAEAKLNASLGLGEKQKLQPERILLLTGMLAEFARSLNGVWALWTKIDTTSRFRRSGDLHNAIKEYVSGTQDMTRGYVKPELDQLREVITGMTNAIAIFSRQIASKYLNELSPDSIKTAARARRFGECRPAPWWEKYEELAWGPTEGVIENMVTNSIADAALIIIKGRRSS